MMMVAPVHDCTFPGQHCIPILPSTGPAALPEYVDNINDVEKYRRMPLLVTRKNAVRLAKDEYFVADLIGTRRNQFCSSSPLQLTQFQHPLFCYLWMMQFIEEIGTYDPSTNPSTFKVNEELAKKWLANGAQPTEQVAKLFKVAGIEK